MPSRLTRMRAAVFDSSADAVVAFGGNLGTDAAIVARFRSALAVLAARFPIRALMRSRIYRSAPVGPVADQPRFLNAAVALRAVGAWQPQELMRELLTLEASLGRVRADSVPQGPRSIDLDLLFVGDAELVAAGPPALRLPHPRIAERAFVLMPLADLYGRDWAMPGIERTVAACLATPALTAQQAEVSVYADRWG